MNRLMSVLALAVVFSLMLVVNGTQSNALALQATAQATLPGDQSGPSTMQPTQASSMGGHFSGAVSLADLLTKYADLQAYLDKTKDTKITDLDFAVLYGKIAQIYKDYGGTGVAVFLQSSGFLKKLGIPENYIDLLSIYDKSGLDALIKRARELKIITAKDELDGFLSIDSADNVAAVQAALKKLGISSYTYDPKVGEIEIGVPLEVLQQYSTPALLLQFLTNVRNIPGVTGFRAPLPFGIGAAGTAAPTGAATMAATKSS